MSYSLKMYYYCVTEFCMSTVINNLEVISTVHNILFKIKVTDTIKEHNNSHSQLLK